MTTKQLSIQHRQSIQTGSNRLTAVMTVMAWAALCTGILLCLLNVNEFNDSNLGLMAGIGCLIGSVQIYVIGAAVKLFHMRGKSGQ